MIQAQVTWYDLSPQALVTNLFLVIVGLLFLLWEGLVTFSARLSCGIGKSLLIISPFPHLECETEELYKVKLRWSLVPPTT